MVLCILVCILVTQFRRRILGHSFSWLIKCHQQWDTPIIYLSLCLAPQSYFEVWHHIIEFGGLRY